MELIFKILETTNCKFWFDVGCVRYCVIFEKNDYFLFDFYGKVQNGPKITSTFDPPGIVGYIFDLIRNALKY